MSARNEEQGTNSMSGMREVRLVRDGTAINLTAVATLTLSHLLQINKDGRHAFASQCLERIQDSKRHTSLRYLTCDVAMLFAEPAFIYEGAVVTFDSYDEPNGRITLKNLFS